MTKGLAESKKRVVSIIYALKYNLPCEVAPVIPVYQKGQVIAVLRVISQASLKDVSEVKRLATWRDKHSKWFPSQFRVTLAGTRAWGQGQLLDKEDRILFMIEDLSGSAVGHVGLNRFDYQKESCEIDNIVRGEKSMPGVMTAAIETLCMWAKQALGVKTYTLCCFADNTKAIALYVRLGFVEVAKIPLTLVRTHGVTVWEENPSVKNARRYFIRMKRKA